ncbi:hypothetical protein Tco_1028668 [Tanacetum coccineum]|uniref:Uncharacterized protein n=1 Tax=Tanacetum coccineum TaxID=301880 RepID=A0ABQ5EY49_9ASTR
MWGTILYRVPKGALATGVAPGIKSIWNSTWRTGGRPGMTNNGHWYADYLVARSFVYTVLGKASSIIYYFQYGGGSISPEGFLSSVLLWLVIIVAVVGVGVTVVVVIIVAVVVVVESSSVVKLSFVGKKKFHQDRASSVKATSSNLTLFAVFDTVLQETLILFFRTRILSGLCPETWLVLDVDNPFGRNSINTR